MDKDDHQNIVAAPLWGVCIFGVAGSQRSTAPWVQRAPIYDMRCGKFISVLTAIIIGGSAALFAQAGARPANVGEGTLMIKGKSYPLKNAVAYETMVDGEEGIVVVLSGPTISSEKLNAAMKSEKAGEIPDFRKPYVKLEFTKAGVFKGWGAGAGDISLGRHITSDRGDKSAGRPGDWQSQSA